MLVMGSPDGKVAGALAAASRKRDSDQKSPLECRNSHRKRRETSRKVLGGSRVLIIPLSRRTSALIPYNIVHCVILCALDDHISSLFIMSK